jgi:hypothetical protein
MTMPWRRALAAAALALAAAVGGVLAAGTAQAQALTTGTLTISGDSNDSITLGKSYSYSTSKGDMMDAASQDGSKVSISVTTPNSGQWNLDFDSPDQPTPSPVLVPGTYTVTQYPYNSRTSPNLYVWRGSGCATGVNGSFTVRKAIFVRQAYGQFYVQAFDATFVQHCDGATSAARGEIRISNPPPPPPPSPSPSTASPSTIASLYAPPTFGPTATATGRDAALAGGGAAGAPPTTTAWTDADRTQFMTIGLAVIAIVILVANLVTAVRSRRMRQAILSPEPRPAGPAAMEGAAMGPWSTDDPAAHRWLQYDPSPAVARRSLPGKVIAVSVVVAVRGTLGLLLTVATIGALHLRAVQALPLPSWYANVLWLQVGICAGQVVSGLLLLLGKKWPRMLGLSVLWFDIAAGTLIMLATTFSCAGLFGIAVDAVLIWMLFWAEVRDWCT